MENKKYYKNKFKKYKIIKFENKKSLYIEHKIKSLKKVFKISVK